MEPSRADARRRLWFAAGGLCYGCCLLLNQKLLLAAPGIVGCAALYLSRPYASSRLGSKLLDVSSFGAASALPLIVLTMYFWRQDAVGDFVRGVLTNNLGWPREVSADSTLRWMARRDPLLLALTVAGLLQTAFMMARERLAWRPPVLLLPAASLIAGLALIPTPYPQYMLPVLPVGAIVGGQFIWAMVSGHSRERTAAERWERLITGGSAVAVMGIGLAVARPFFVNALVYPVLGVVALVTAGVLVSRKRPAWAAAILILAGSTYSVQQLRWMQGLSNADAVSEMRYIHSITKPTDRVLDGFTGVGWFRPHAYFYAFLHPGIRARLTARQTADVLAMLADCKRQPKVVILDENLRALSPALAPLVARDYAQTSFGPIWVRHDTGGRCSTGSPVGH